jgi:hypothetical protein
MEVACGRQLGGQGDFAKTADAHVNHAFNLLQRPLDLEQPWPG